MNREIATRSHHHGSGIIELMVGLVVALLMVLLMFQVYQINEGQKRTVTAGSDAQQDASYGLYFLGRYVAVGGSGIASSAAVLDQCALLRSIPVLITAGGSATVPDSITLLFGGSDSLSTPIDLLNTATVTSLVSATAYQVRAPVAFSPQDVIVAVQGTNCTLSKINAGGVSVNSSNGIATLTHTPLSGSVGVTYQANNASVVNLGQTAAIGRVQFLLNAANNTLTMQNLFPAAGVVTPVMGDVVNFKAQYGLDTDNDGIVDTWQDPSGAIWSAANLTAQPLATLQQILAVRIAIVTRSPQYEKDVVTAGPLIFLNGTVSMTLTADQQHYRYKVLETIVPLRNALWNTP
jgi:type IV pilus assembly protein PilW